jgi:hypothetical protein
MVVYNLTNLQNLTSFPALVSVTNEASGGLLVGLFILAIWVVLLMSFLKFDFMKALASSSFVCFILSIFLVYLDLLNIIILLGFLFITAVSGLVLYLSED